MPIEEQWQSGGRWIYKDLGREAGGRVAQPLGRVIHVQASSPQCVASRHFANMRKAMHVFKDRCHHYSRKLVQIIRFSSM